MRGCFYNTIKKEIFFKINILVNTYTYYFGFIIALIVSGCSIPLVNNVSIKLNLVDKPEKRKQHKKNIVRLGGLSILLGIYVSIIILMRFNFLIFPEESLIWPIFNFAPLFFLLGFIDDIFDLSPFFRLFFQVLLSILFCFKGFLINSFQIENFLSTNINLNVDGIFATLLTVIWIVGLINAINWIDGLDGLATGILSISLLGLITISGFFQNFSCQLLLLIIFGSCLAFLSYNKYPAKILMGDGGSYLLGFLMSSLGIFSFSESMINVDLKFNVVPLSLIYIVPLFDMTLVIFSRIKASRSIFYPDRSHIHHRFLDLGFSHQNTVILILAISQFFVSLAVALILNSYQKFIPLTSFLILISIFFAKCDVKHLSNLKLIPRNQN